MCLETNLPNRALTRNVLLTAVHGTATHATYLHRLKPTCAQMCLETKLPNLALM
jgi:hypothetical protein